MSKLGVLIGRKIFESGDAKRIAKQEQDKSDLVLQKDTPYLNDGDRGHLLDIDRLPGTSKHGDGSAKRRKMMVASSFRTKPSPCDAFDLIWPAVQWIPG